MSILHPEVWNVNGRGHPRDANANVQNEIENVQNENENAVVDVIVGVDASANEDVMAKMKESVIVDVVERFDAPYDQ